MVGNVSGNTVDMLAAVIGSFSVDESTDCVVNVVIADKVSIIVVEFSNVADVIVVSVFEVLNGFSEAIVVDSDVSAVNGTVVVSPGETVKLSNTIEDVADNLLVSSIAIAGISEVITVVFSRIVVDSDIIPADTVEVIVLSVIVVIN